VETGFYLCLVECSVSFNSSESGWKGKKRQKWVPQMDRTCHRGEWANHYDNHLRLSVGVFDFFYSLVYGCKEKDIKTLASQSAARGHAHPPHLAKIKIIDLDKFYNFFIYDFFTWNHLRLSKILFEVLKFYNSNFKLFKQNQIWRNEQNKSCRSWWFIQL